jgi:hypothetical protein
VAIASISLVYFKRRKGKPWREDTLCFLHYLHTQWFFYLHLFAKAIEQFFFRNRFNNKFLKQVIANWIPCTQIQKYWLTTYGCGFIVKPQYLIFCIKLTLFG